MANRWEKVETVTDFIFLASKITADRDCSHEIKRCLLLGRKAITNLDSLLGLPGGFGYKESVHSVGDLGWEDPLEKEMATHSSILAWRIPWTEEPGWLQSMGSHIVGHDRVTNTSCNNNDAFSTGIKLDNIHEKPFIDGEV